MITSLEMTPSRLQHLEGKLEEHSGLSYSEGEELFEYIYDLEGKAFLVKRSIRVETQLVEILRLLRQLEVKDVTKIQKKQKKQIADAIYYGEIALLTDSTNENRVLI